LLHVGANNNNNNAPHIITSHVNRILEEIDCWERDNIWMTVSHSLCDMTLQRSGFIHPDQGRYNKVATRWMDRIIASGKVDKCE
jgi:hypothetical protein